jgi:quercetin dioxygenase-like cupin family protein
MVRLIDNPEVHAGQSVLTPAGERVRYSAGPDGTEYVAVCVPAFASELAHRDE